MSFKEKAKAISERKGFLNLEGKEKLETVDIIADYKDGITLTGVDLMNKGSDDCYSVWTFNENKKAFFFGGKLLTDFAKECIEDAGSIEEANAQLKGEEIKIKLTNGKTKNGHRITKFEVVD